MEKRVIYQNKAVVYEKEGRGPVLVFLHGFLENRTIWNGFINQMKEQFTCIAVDLPGFGKSDIFSENHTMALMADTVKAVLNAETISSAVLIGHSMGGYVALAFAKKFPFVLRGLVLFHSQAAADDQGSKQNRTRTIEVVKKDHQNFISNFIPLLFAEENMNKLMDEIVALKQMALKTSAMGVVAALAGMRDREDSRELLTQLNVPLFFVVGKQDSRIPLDKILPQLTLSKHTEVLLLEGVGHMGFIEDPQIIFPVLTGFFNRCLL